jgi:poly-beta-1,6-N-acetyl-D-glucosamine synthase
MDIVAFIFWFLLFLVFYNYIGYAVILFIINLFRRKPRMHTGDLPAVTVVIAAYNEEKVITEKLLNTASLNYPKELLKVLIVDDGSTDATREKISEFPFAHVLHQKERKGKSAALNYAMQEVQTPLVLFSDANTMLNVDCILHLVKHFADERTGAVAGEKKVAHTSGVGTAEGWYWKYESLMKELDARFYSIVGATGELFCMRTVLFQPIDEDMILDDFTLSIGLCLNGYRVRYEPHSYAVELPSASFAEEKKRKIRIASGAFQALSKLSLSKLLRHLRLFFQFISRRWLRWVVCPFAIPLLLILNVILAFQHPDSVFDTLLLLQLIFYGLAILGLVFTRHAFFVITIPFYFLFMNYCMAAGLIRYRQGKHSALWSRSERATMG